MEYYISLTDALAGTGALADAAGAKVSVGADAAGVRHVVLLEDVTESGDVNVTQSMVLVLGGKVLTLAGGSVNFGAGTVCAIDGTMPGSRILRSGSGATAGIVVASGEKLTVKGGDYDALGSFTGNITAVKVTAGKLVLEDAKVSSENTCTDNHYLYSRAVQCNPGTDAVILGGRLEAQGQDQANALVVGGKAKVEGVALEAVSTSTGELYTPAATVMVIGTAELEMEDCQVHCSTQNISGYGVFNNGADVTLTDCNVTVESQSGAIGGVTSSGTMRMERCEVSSESVSGSVTGVSNLENGEMYMYHCRVRANTNAMQASTGFYNTGMAYVEHCDVLADSQKVQSGVGVGNNGVCYLIHTDVAGIHSGMSNSGHIFICGGTFTGWTHGGMYFAPGGVPRDENGESGAGYLCYVCDAYTRCGYFGQHADILKAGAAPFVGCGYLGSACEVTVYMDNCVIGGTPMVDFDLEQYRADVEAYIAENPDCGLQPPLIKPPAFCFRRALGEHDNIMLISNSKVLEGTNPFRIDKGFDGEDLGHRLYVGCGTNITTEWVNNRAHTIFVPEENFRQNMAWFKAQVCE